MLDKGLGAAAYPGKESVEKQQTDRIGTDCPRSNKRIRIQIGLCEKSESDIKESRVKSPRIVSVWLSPLLPAATPEALEGRKEGYSCLL